MTSSYEQAHVHNRSNCSRGLTGLDVRPKVERIMNMEEWSRPAEKVDMSVELQPTSPSGPAGMGSAAQRRDAEEIVEGGVT